MKRILLILLVFGAFAGSVLPVGVAAVSQPSFVGHGCSIATCRYFTSSYHTARYYYDRRTCSQWKSLSRTYLRGFTTVTALHHYFPNRILHPPC